jgi:hypothetical protein
VEGKRKGKECKRLARKIEQEKKERKKKTQSHFRRGLIVRKLADLNLHNKQGAEHSDNGKFSYP